MRPPPVENPQGRHRRRLARSTLALASIVAPFAWFAIRHLGGPLDAVAIGMPLIGASSVVILGAIAAITRRPWPAVLGLSILAVCVLATVGPRLPQPTASPDPEIVIAFANVYRDNPSEREARSDLVDRGADVLTAIEVPDQQFSNRLAKNASDLPYLLEHGWGAVWSRWELDDPVEFEWAHADVARAIVRHPSSPFVLYLVYAANPLGSLAFDEQRSVIERISGMIAAEPLPVVIAGDLNTSDRTSGYRLLESSLRDAMRAETLAGTTYVGDAWRSLFLRIDYMFVSPSWCAVDPVIFPVSGSDHRGIETRVGPCPAST
jgi:endonuclease/exonuclease/phosphatase (EEP) superfamily protein YafD